MEDKRSKASHLSETQKAHLSGEFVFVLLKLWHLGL